MRAITQDRYGGPEVLELRDIATPVPKDDEVLVRVHAAGLDRGVWHVMAGLPYLTRVVVPTMGLRRPKAAARGMDLAGRVEAVGREVTRFRPGDAVFGWTEGGSYAEYATVPEDHLVAMPANLGFEQAAAVPHLRPGRPPGRARRRRGQGRPAGAGHRGRRRGRVVRRAAGQGVRGAGHRGRRHGPAGADPLGRRRRGDRLHPRRRHRRVAPLGRRPRHRRPPVAVPAPARPHPRRHPGHRRQRGAGTPAGRLRPQPAGGGLVAVRGPAAADAQLHPARTTSRPWPSCSRPARSRR
jgi:hypothetical protein